MIVSFISLKGGVGKTTLSNNLAAYIRRFYNHKVLIIDTNGFYSSNLIFLKDKNIFGDKLWQDIKILPFFHLRIYNGLPDSYENDLNYLKRVYDLIIFDVFPNENLIYSVQNISDINFLVLNPDLYSIYVNKKLYDKINKEKIKIILNKYDKSIDIDFVEEIFGKDIYSVIPYIKDLNNYQFQYSPVAFYNERSKALKYIDQLSYLLTGKRRKTSLIDIIFG